MTNTQEELFEQNYPELYGLLLNLVSAWHRGEDTTELKQQIVNYLSDVYEKAYLEEATYILSVFGGEDIDDIDKATIRENSGLGVYKNRHNARLKSILTTHEDNIKSYLAENENVSEEDLKNYYIDDLERFAISEIQMSVEYASVDSGKLIQAITGEKIMKTWNSVLDSNTCPICAGLHGTTVPVDEPFSSDLDYTGGDITYAHPRCRCWVTYSKA